MSPEELKRRLDRLEEHLQVLLLSQQETRAELSALSELLAWSLQHHHKEDRFDLLEFWKQKRVEALAQVQKSSEQMRATVRTALQEIHDLTGNPPQN